MGKKASWFSLKKVINSDSKVADDQKPDKSKKKWFGKQKNSDPVSLSEDTTALSVPSHPPPPPPPPPKHHIKDVKLTEAENEQSSHADSVALATAVAEEEAESENEQSSHADLVALATAVAEEEAVLAAQAAAEAARHADEARFPGKSKEEVAVIKIQTAFRGYLARRALRALRGLDRLKTLIGGKCVKRQATTTLTCMQTLARVQSQIRARRIRMSEENQALQRQLQQKRDKEFEKLKVVQMGEEWNDSTGSKEQVKAKLQSRHEAAMRRQRALAYAFSHQQTWKHASKSANRTLMDPNNPHWGWSWLERWMAARPWESSCRSTMIDYNGSFKSPTSHAMSAGEVSSSRAKPSPTAAQKLSRPLSCQAPSTPPPSKAASTSAVTGKIKQPSPKGSQCGGDDSSRSMFSVRSDQHRRHSIAGSSVRDDKSLASPPLVSSSKVPTRSVKSMFHLPSPLGSEKKGTTEKPLEKTGTQEKPSLGSAKRRLSIGGFSALSRRHSGPC